MRMLLLVALLPLAACAGTPHVDVCKYSSARRMGYTTTIRAINLYALSGRVVPYEMALGKRAAETALAVLNSTCPELPIVDPG